MYVGVSLENGRALFVPSCLCPCSPSSITKRGKPIFFNRVMVGLTTTTIIIIIIAMTRCLYLTFIFLVPERKGVMSCLKCDTNYKTPKYNNPTSAEKD